MTRRESYSTDPVTTVAGMHLGNLLGGAVVVETLFGWPGMGRLALEAVLARDFSVTEREGAEAAVTKIVHGLPSQPSDDDLALWIGRASHLATGAAAVGYVSAQAALQWLVPAVELAVERFSGWDNYAQSFLAGEREAPGSNFVGRKLLASMAQKLLESERSPWKTVAWPERDSLAELLASRETPRST